MKVASKNSAGKDVPIRRGGRYVLSETEQPYSVTTVLNGGLPKQHVLMGWAARVAALAILDDPSLSVEEAVGKIYEKRDSAGGKGTTLHAWAELVTKGVTPDVSLLPEALQPQGRAFLKFCQDRQPEVLMNEFMVYAPDLYAAGQVDRCLRFPSDTYAEGEADILDLKTGRGLYPEMFVQQAVYRHAMNTTGKGFRRAVDAEGNSFIEWYPVPKCRKTFLLHLRDTGDYSLVQGEGSLDVFRAAKVIYEWEVSNKDKRDPSTA